MTDPIKVDVHMHLYPSASSGAWWKGGYEIWEYGAKDDVAFSRYHGTVDDALDAMAKAGFRHGVAVNMLSVDLFREEAVAALPEDLPVEQRARAVAEIERTMADRFRASNRWLVELLGPIPRLTAYVGVDPWALTPEQNVEHLREMAERGARGIKLHPVAQRFEPGDPRMERVYRACEAFDLVVLSHTGSAKGAEPFAEPRAFAPVLERHPLLKVVLAHLGGGSWRQTLDLARAFPQVAFDLCEIIEWTGAPGAPGDQELARMIREIGPERVMLGTDFPWYDLDRTVELVMGLPLLATGEKEEILGANAVRILDLPVDA
ncbi:MAG TPA: amidohydrolase family protein [Actinomycetes bacterium]|nr:amidohydrolase family protein [Actinomycetes bacterium]